MSYKKRILLVFLLAVLFAAAMFFIKERPFKIVPKEKIPQVIEEHEHPPGAPAHEH